MYDMIIKFEGMKLMFDVGEYNFEELKDKVKEALEDIKIENPFLYDRSLKLANSVLERCI